MKRELLTHLFYWFVFFLLIVLVKRYFDVYYLVPFILGGLLGVVLPDIDHLIYVYFIKPNDLSSQRVYYLINKSEIKRSIALLYETREERRELVFHTIFFQGIFFVLMFLMLSSSGSALGRGLVISFMLHLCVDQWIDLKKLGNLDNWHKYLSFKLDPYQSKMYWIASSAIILLMGILI